MTLQVGTGLRFVTGPSGSIDEVALYGVELTPARILDHYQKGLSGLTTSFAYDQNGNELSAGGRTFTYDLANRLTATTATGTTTTYSYDGDGVRLQASTGSQASEKTNFLWDVNQGLPQVALERDGSNALLRRYVYGVRRISMTSGSNTSYYIQDGLGSVANLTSSSGATQWTWSYEPFGSIRTETKASGNQPDNFLKFTGEYLDPTGLYHLRARQYDPGTGRFSRPDPIEASSLTSFVSDYVYVSDQPTVMIDPTGLTLMPSEAGRSAAQRATSLVRRDLTSAQLNAEIPRPPGVPGIINDKEWAYCTAVWDPGRTLECFNVFTLYGHARDRANWICGDWQDNDGPCNAFFHAYWSGVMTYSLGASKAWFFANLREDDNPTGKPAINAKRMDLHNDSVGIAVARRFIAQGLRGGNFRFRLEASLHVATVPGQGVLGMSLWRLNTDRDIVSIRTGRVIR